MTHLDWPFFEEKHRELAANLEAWCAEHLAHAHHDESRDAVDAECIRLVRLLGSGGWLRHAVAGSAHTTIKLYPSPVATYTAPRAMSTVGADQTAAPAANRATIAARCNRPCATIATPGFRGEQGGAPR